MRLWRGHRSSDRGLVEPTAALIATVVVCLGVSLYAGALEEVVPNVDRDVAEPTLTQVRDALTTGGVVRPSRRALARAQAPAGYDLNVSVEAADRRWHLGPPVPGGDGPARRIDRARCRASVVLAPGRVRPGSLEVAVWT